ncbi:MAG: TRAP transporter small permease [Oscillospiraceae bacterium]|nr:TRAP transporter small permease [Oscillospiraceae bacterium]
MKDKKSLVQKLDRAIGRITQIGGLVTPILIVFIMLLIVFDVTRRTLFDSPVNGSVELIQCLIAVAGFMAMGWTTYKDKHIRIDSLTGMLPKPAAHVLDIVTSIVPLVVLIPLTMQSYVRMRQAIDFNEATAILQLPMYPFLFFVVVGYALLVLGQIMVIIRGFLGEVPAL